MVIGNPPYISHHNLPKDQYKRGIEVIKKLNIAGFGKASLWAYFVLHGMSFLNKGGRMAWVLPSSFLYTNYAEKLREILCKRFSRSIVIRLGDRLFLEDGTEEISVIVLCTGLDETTDNKRQMAYSFVQSAHQLTDVIRNWEGDQLADKHFANSASLSLLR